MTDKMETGDIGENLAAEYFRDKGYKIAARKFRSRHAEIDLIVQRENWLLFVEVKTRNSNAWGEPESFVSNAQRAAIYEAAENYIYKVDWQGHIRFDIVSVRPGNPPDIVHFEDAISY